MEALAETHLGEEAKESNPLKSYSFFSKGLLHINTALSNAQSSSYMLCQYKVCELGNYYCHPLMADGETNHNLGKTRKLMAVAQFELELPDSFIAPSFSH